MKKSSILSGLIIVMTASLVSCRGSSGSSNSPTADPGSMGKIDSIDITDAANLFVTGVDPSGLYLQDNTVLKPATLYKTTSAGVVMEVTFKEGDQVMTTIRAPIAITSPDPRMVLMDFDSSQYLVNKETGKAYVVELKNMVSQVVGDGSNAGLHLDDRDIALYGIKSNSAVRPLVRLSFAGDNLVLEELSAAGDSVESFSKDKDGNFVYKSGTYKKRGVDGKFSNLPTLACSNSTSDGRILGYTRNGYASTILNAVTGAVLKEWSKSPKFLLKSMAENQTFTNISIFSATNGTAWCALSNNHSGSGCIQITDPSPADVVALLNASGKATANYNDETKILEIDMSAEDALLSVTSWWVYKYMPQVCGPSLARLGSKVINQGMLSGVEVFDESDNSLTLINLKADIHDLKTSSQYVYGISNGFINKINVNTKTVTSINVPNLLEVKSYSVSKGDEITLNGTLDDGSSFIGRISAAGELNILSKTGSGAVTIITPLN